MEKRKGKVKAVSETELQQRLASSDADDRRSDPRIPARIEVEVPLSWDELRRVYTSNISKGGLLFLVEGPAKIAGAVELTLRLPDDRTVTVPSEVRHVASREGSSEFEVGVQFKGLDDATRERLETELARLGQS